MEQTKDLGKQVQDLKDASVNFKDWINASLELVKPWKYALIFTNLFWAVVLALFIGFAYLMPETTTQNQDFTGQTQSQSTGSPNADK